MGRISECGHRERRSNCFECYFHAMKWRANIDSEHSIDIPETNRILESIRRQEDLREWNK